MSHAERGEDYATTGTQPKTERRLLMPRVIENRGSHVFLQMDDGTVDVVPWSKQNKLVYKHGLENFLIERSEELQFNQDPKVILSPDGDNQFRITVDLGDEELSSIVPQHMHKDFLDALDSVYQSEQRDIQPLLDLAEDLIDYKVYPPYVEKFADIPLFADAVEVKEEGWLINDHVLLTYDNEFYHPNVQDSRRDGKVLDESANRIAYELRFKNRPDTSGQTRLESFDGFNTDEVVEFIARAMWAVSYTPETL